MEKVVIFGTGSGAKKVRKTIDLYLYKVVAYLDNNIDTHGKFIDEVDISGPELLNEIEYDKIVICSTAYNEIRKQLMQEYNVSVEKIVNNLYFLKKELVNYYSNKEENNEEIIEILDFLNNNDLQVFNYDFRKNYLEYKVDVYWDENVNMFFSIYKNKRMYFKKSFRKIEDIVKYISFLSQEQDYNSPHRYLTKDINVNKGDIVIDAGVAEGNFALDIIEDIAKIYLIESDKEWIQALKETFKEYEEKVVFVDKFLSNINDEDNITLDQLIQTEEINFIKMDIEGAETKALAGAIDVLKRNKNIKVDICCYHNKQDEQAIKTILSQLDFSLNLSNGYMFYVDDSIYENKEPRLVRGLVRGVKVY